MDTKPEKVADWKAEFLRGAQAWRNGSSFNSAQMTDAFYLGYTWAAERCPCVVKAS